MAKLIYALSKTGLETAFTNQQITTAGVAGSIYRSVAFTEDGYLVTHGKYFRIFNHADNIFSSTTTNGVATLTSGGKTLTTIDVGLTTVVGGNLLTAGTVSSGSITIDHDIVSVGFGGTVGSDATNASVAVPKFTVDDYGHVTFKGTSSAVLDNVKILADITAAGEYRVLLGSTLGTAETIQLNKASTLKFNPSTGTLTASKYIGTLNSNIGINLNNAGAVTFDNTASRAFAFFAPTASGTTGTGTYLTPTTNGAPVWQAADSVVTQSSGNLVTSGAVYSAVNNIIASADAMVFKGTIGTGGTYTITAFNALVTYNAGWTFRVIEAGTIKGNVCQIGDLVIAMMDRSGSGNLDTDFTVAQTNIDGAVTTATNLTANQLVVGNDAQSVKLLAAGTNGNVLTMAAGIPAWAAPTLNTAGAVEATSTKLYLIGTTTQGANPVTNSNALVYIGTDNKLYSNGTAVLTDISGYVKNNLTYATSDTTYALSAYQGYLLNRNDVTAVSLTTTTLTLTVASGNLTASVPTWNQNTNGTAAKATNLVGGVLGSVPYQSGIDATLFVAPNTTATKKFFSQTGTGTVGAAPSWITLVTTDITDIASASTGITKVGTINTGVWNGTTIASGYGGTGLSSFAKGSILYASAVNTWGALAGGTDGQFLKFNATSGLPEWAADNNTWRLVNAYSWNSTAPGTLTYTSIGGNDLDFGDEFIWNSTTTELKLGWAEVDASNVISYQV